jgi:phosphoenolpyruvate carboxylase
LNPPEQLFTAGLEQVLSPANQDMRQQDKALMDELAEIACQRYLSLKNHADFVANLEQMTPLKWYGDTKIASRPTRRNAGKEGIEFKICGRFHLWGHGRR